MITAASLVLIGAIALFVYTYFGYPSILWVIGRSTERARPTAASDWPTVSITVPAYNEEAQIRGLLRSLLAIDYPRDRLQILIVSDASSDRTDDIVREYSDQGVELLRMSTRGGKTRAENAAAPHLRGDIVVNSDASIRIAPDALKALVTAFTDPTVGLASGRDVSVGPDEELANAGESGYVGYEMGVRRLETRVAGIIGASGCFYAIRPGLHRLPLPEALSRDFAAALHAIEHGYRAVSVDSALCSVPRAVSLRKEYRRKVRTITRGMETLWHKRSLLNPVRHGVFAWMLWSHKVARWAVPWAAAAAFVALGVAGGRWPLAQNLFLAGLGGLGLAALGWLFADRPKLPRILSIPAFVVAGNVAAMHALVRALSGDDNPTWEPTRRSALPQEEAPDVEVADTTL